MINFEKTAIYRKTISKPLEWALNENHISKEDYILDYGCGKGFDSKFLLSQNFNVFSYDKYQINFQIKPKGKFNLILLNYVLNVIPKSKKPNFYIKNSLY